MLCEGTRTTPGTLALLDLETREMRSVELGHYPIDMTFLPMAASDSDLAPVIDEVEPREQDQDRVAAAEYGERVFNAPDFSDSTFNAFSCATCHSVSESQADAFVGPSLYNTVFRQSWWGGGAPRLLDAVNYCFTFFMRDEPLEASDKRGRALYEYLVSISPEQGMPALEITFQEATRGLPAGDPEQGAMAYDTHCRRCHGEPHTGEGRLSNLVVPIPQGLVAWAVAEGEKYGGDPFPAGPLVIDKVRHGQFYGVGGNMPFFAPEILGDDDLAAIVAFLGL